MGPGVFQSSPENTNGILEGDLRVEISVMRVSYSLGSENLSKASSVTDLKSQLAQPSWHADASILLRMTASDHQNTLRQR